MRNILFSLLIFITTSCDYGIGVYIKNNESDTVLINTKFINSDFFDTLKIIKATKQFYNINNIDFHKFEDSLKIFKSNEHNYYLKIPPKTTIFINPTFLGQNIEWINFNNNDTLLLKDNNWYEKFRNNGIIEQENISNINAKVIINIKLNEIKRILSNE